MPLFIKLNSAGYKIYLFSFHRHWKVIHVCQYFILYQREPKISDCREWYGLINSSYQKIPQTHPPGTQKKGFGLDLAVVMYFMWIGRKPSQEGFIKGWQKFCSQFQKEVNGSSQLHSPKDWAALTLMIGLKNVGVSTVELDYPTGLLQHWPLYGGMTCEKLARHPGAEGIKHCQPVKWLLLVGKCNVHDDCPAEFSVLLLQVVLVTGTLKNQGICYRIKDERDK